MLPHPYTTDTTPEAQAVQLERFRAMTPAERLRAACGLGRQARRMAVDAIRRRHPDCDAGTVRLKLIEIVYGPRLAEDVRLWQMERPE